VKKRIAWTAIPLVCGFLVLIGLKLFYLGLRFATERSPDGRFSVHFDQILNPRHPILSLRDSDFANGYIRLVTSDGHKIKEVYTTGLTFVIVNWRGDHVEIQADHDYKWPLP
jgi:hypothetical protein